MYNGLNWANTDPRSYFNKYGKIVIVRPSIKGFGLSEAGCGEVDSKETWSISTSFEGYPFITADDKWNNDWQWIRGPE